MTTAVANAIAITLDRRAAAEWRSRQRDVAELEPPSGETPAQTRREYRDAVDRLATMFPGAVKVH